MREFFDPGRLSRFLIPLWLLSVFFTPIPRLPAEEPVRPFSFAANPAFYLAIESGENLFRAGRGVSVSGSWILPNSSGLLAAGGFGTSTIPLQNNAGNLGIQFATIGGGIRQPVSDSFSAHALVCGGPFIAFLKDERQTTAEWSTVIVPRCGLTYSASAAVDVSLDLVYREFLGLMRDAGLEMGVAYRFGGASTERRARPEPRPQPLRETAAAEPEPPAVPDEVPVPIAEPGVSTHETDFGSLELRMTPLFPVFYSHYNDNSFGTAQITNSRRWPIENATVSFYVGQYMENPKASSVVPAIAPGDSASIDLYGLFTSDILEITEGAKLSGRFIIDYTMRGDRKQEEVIETVEAYNRNAMTWDDDQKICAFVTAKDPAVMRFARNVTGIVHADKERGVPGNLMAAMALHEALDCYGLHYIPDPVTPYAEFSLETSGVDYLLFPSQTLEYQGGDCDDLSALYCALLESIGIETAFITIPGHIYAAFSLGISPDQARSVFKHPDELIFRDDSTWVPVEITVRYRGFLDAWQQGAKQWREYDAAGQAAVFPVHAGWDTYQPVGLPGTTTPAALDSRAIDEAFRAEVVKFVDREIATEIASIQVRRDEDRDNPRWPNRLGILYARYGVDDRAIGYFEDALRLRGTYTPALVNLGNIRYLTGDVAAALRYYESAEARAPDDPDVLLNIARANHELENYGTARAAYARLQQVSPALANRFAYLDLRGAEAERAAQAGEVEGIILWSDEGGAQ